MHRSITRRLIPALAGRVVAALLVVVFALPALAQEKVRSARLWPSQDYTRLTIESERPVRYSLMLVKNPERVVIDLEDVDAASLQAALSGKLVMDDPYVASARVGNFKPGTVRLVLDLKGEVRPQMFALMPVGEYGHRLVLDLYPIVPPDPLMALVQGRETPAQPADPAPESEKEKVLPPSMEPRADDVKPHKPKADTPRMLTVVIDAGHGGEDPGARGRNGTMGKERHAVDRAAPGEDDRRRAQHARGADARRGLLHPAAHCASTRRGASRPTSSSRSTRMRSSCRAPAARRCSRCRSAARPARRRAGSPSRRTTPI